MKKGSKYEVWTFYGRLWTTFDYERLLNLTLIWLWWRENGVLEISKQIWGSFHRGVVFITHSPEEWRDIKFLINEAIKKESNLVQLLVMRFGWRVCRAASSVNVEMQASTDVSVAVFIAGSLSSPIYDWNICARQKWEEQTMDFDAARRMQEVPLLAELSRREIVLSCVFPIRMRITQRLKWGFT